MIEIPHLVIDGPATLTSVELPQPVSASTARQPARMGLALRTGRGRHNIRNQLRPTEPVCNPGTSGVSSQSRRYGVQTSRTPRAVDGASRSCCPIVQGRAQADATAVTVNQMLGPGTPTIRRADKLGGKTDDLLRPRSSTPNCPNCRDHRQGRYADRTCASHAAPAERECRCSDGRGELSERHSVSGDQHGALPTSSLRSMPKPGRSLKDTG